MKTVLLVLALLTVPLEATAQTSPEECAATFSARLAAVRAELEAHSRRGGASFVQPRHPENEACETDDARHRITLVLRTIAQMGEPTERIARLRQTLEQLAVMTYGQTGEEADRGREAIAAGRAALARLRAEAVSATP